MIEHIKIHPKDIVAVATVPLKTGMITIVGDREITLINDIPAGHKFALISIEKGQPIIKYGLPIGYATEDIAAGRHVHTHNARTLLNGELEYTYAPQAIDLQMVHSIDTFKGYVRKNGRVGVRNELWILPTVGCVNNVATTLERRCAHLVKGSVEGIHAFVHPYGCSQMGEDQENTRAILAGLTMHPNAGGVLVLGLGCENTGVGEIKTRLGDYDESRVKFLICQDVEDELSAAGQLIEQIAAEMARDVRLGAPVSKLVIGMKCGGSDGFSGITANPVIGGFSDMLISRGGSTILTEVPEMFGAETLLMARCESKAVFDKTVALINDFKRYFEEHNQTIYENPSPGNKAGGITTLEDKALGCTQKSGAAGVSDVLSYGERVKTSGLSLLNAPGNDLVASTACAAAGAQIVLFSTGRGTPFASPAPTIKISSNSRLAGTKHSWIDFDAGRMLDGLTCSQLSQELYDMVIRVASGERIRSEINGYHDMAIFKNGVTL